MAINRRMFNTMVVSAAFGGISRSSDAEAWVGFLRLFARLIGGSNKLGKMNRLKKGAMVAGGTGSALYGSSALANVSNVLSSGTSVAWLYQMCQEVDPEVSAMASRYGATDLFMSDAHETDLKNVVTMQTRSIYSDLYTDQLDVISTDLITGRSELIFSTTASVAPVGITEIHGEVYELSNGPKRIEARFRQDQGRHYFASKNVIVADRSQITLKL